MTNGDVFGPFWPDGEIEVSDDDSVDPKKRRRWDGCCGWCRHWDPDDCMTGYCERNGVAVRSGEWKLAHVRSPWDSCVDFQDASEDDKRERAWAIY